MTLAHPIATENDILRPERNWDHHPLYLTVQPEPDMDGQWEWVIVERDGNEMIMHAESEGSYPVFADALRAGAVAFAVHTGQDYEDEAAEPVGNVAGVGYTE